MMYGGYSGQYEGSARAALGESGYKLSCGLKLVLGVLFERLRRKLIGMLKEWHGSVGLANYFI